jgi:cytoskeletal protein CcmA (bactofilin family)
MARVKRRFPDYVTIIGPETEVRGEIRFTGGLHIDGKVMGDVAGSATENCGLTLGRTGVIEGNLDVARVVIDGTVIGDVRAVGRAELAPGARIEGTLFYGVLEMAEGAEVNGKVLHISDDVTPRLAFHGAGQEGSVPAAASGRGQVREEEEGAEPSRSPGVVLGRDDNT